MDDWASAKPALRRSARPRADSKRTGGIIAHFKNDVILSGVTRGCVSRGVCGRVTEPKDLSSIYEAMNGKSKRDSSAACPGASRKTKSAGHSARNDGVKRAEKPQAFPVDVAGNA